MQFQAHFFELLKDRLLGDVLVQHFEDHRVEQAKELVFALLRARFQATQGRRNVDGLRLDVFVSIVVHCFVAFVKEVSRHFQRQDDPGGRQIWDLSERACTCAALLSGITSSSLNEATNIINV